MHDANDDILQNDESEDELNQAEIVLVEIAIKLIHLTSPDLREAVISAMVDNEEDDKMKFTLSRAMRSAMACGVVEGLTVEGSQSLKLCKPGSFTLVETREFQQTNCA